MAEEDVMLIDQDNQPRGSCPRSRMRHDNLWHRSSYVFVLSTPRSEWVVQRRTSTKDYCPSHLDLATGGVVQADETYDDNATRELAEELGLQGLPLTPLGTFKYEDARCRTWGGLYLCLWPGRDVAQLRLQPEEVAEVLLMTSNDIECCIAAATDLITPDSVVAFRVLRQRRPDLFSV